MTTMNNASTYAGLSLNERVHIALELAERIRMSHGSFFDTVEVLVEKLNPSGGSANPEALKLAEALLEQLRDMRPHCELMDCLDSMRASSAH
jgi:hypothetical protein